MYSEKKHIIEKVCLEVNTSSEKEAHRIQRNAEVYIQNKLFPLLEKLFDEFDSGTDIIRFDQLDIDFSLENWQDEDTLKLKLTETLRTHLNGQRGPVEMKPDTEGKFKQAEPIKQLIDPEQNHQAAFLFFIENGYLPWFGKQEYITEVTSPEKWTKYLRNDNFLTELKEVLRTKKMAVERMVFQFSNEVIVDFVVVCNILIVRDKSRLLDFIDNSEYNFRNNFLKCVLMFSVQSADNKKCLDRLIKIQAAGKKYKAQNITELIEEMEKLNSEMRRYFTGESLALFLPDSEDDSRKRINELLKIKTDVISGKGSNESVNSPHDKKPTIQNEEFVTDEKEPLFFGKDKRDILVKNAGLVILGPFFTTFLKQFNWLEESGMIKKEERDRAVQSLHFMACGETNFFEGNLSFEKFLCGVPLSTPIPKQSLLNNEVLKETENLFRQVIKHWPELKNTGTDGLRQMFLNRNGKLIKTERGFKVIVERKAQDILLDKLQWNISLLKLPWKKELLFVEW